MTSFRTFIFKKQPSAFVYWNKNIIPNVDLLTLKGCYSNNFLLIQKESLLTANATILQNIANKNWQKSQGIGSGARMLGSNLGSAPFSLSYWTCSITSLSLNHLFYKMGI